MKKIPPTRDEDLHLISVVTAVGNVSCTCYSASQPASFPTCITVCSGIRIWHFGTNWHAATASIPPFFCKREEKVTLSRRQVNLLKEAKTLHAAAAACWPFILFSSLF
uniref:(northern house mosquito) hypothetical protein n=1 Tax=Culex pipiens TaxID=7175 RepID=A0A8D8J4R2_CULPI